MNSLVHVHRCNIRTLTDLSLVNLGPDTDSQTGAAASVASRGG